MSFYCVAWIFLLVLFSLPEITKLCLQSVQDVARQVEVEVAERVSVLEEEHQAKLALLNSEKQHIAELSEEIRLLKEELIKQKDSSEQNEKHLKEEMEKVICTAELFCVELGKLQPGGKAKQHLNLKVPSPLKL